jgi:hypothetical protein
MKKIFNILLFGCFLFVLYKYNQKCLSTDKIESMKSDNNERPNLIKEPTVLKQSIDNKPQDDPILLNDMTLKTWYPNTWIEKIDSNGNPIYNSREKETGVKENFIETKSRFTYEYNSPRSTQMDGVDDPSNGKTLKEIYDNSFVDYKKMVLQKKIVSKKEDEINIKQGASNLSYIIPDTWVYENEKPENGGSFYNGIMANDPLSSYSTSNSLAYIS